MAANKLHFSLVSPQRELFAGAVDQVDAPGAEGDFGVLANHAPFMTTLKEGQIRVYNDGPNLPTDWDHTQSGVGTENVRARLRNLYGDKFVFTLHNHKSGVEALLSVPYNGG